MTDICATCGGFYNPACAQWPACRPAPHAAPAAPAGPTDTVSILLDMTTTLSRVEGQNALILGEQARLAAEQVKLSDGRGELYKRLDALASDHASLKLAVDGHTPHIKEYASLRQNIKGGVVVAGVFGAMLMAALLFTVKEVWQWAAVNIHIR